MRKLPFLVVALVSLGGCAEVRMLGGAAIEKRRAMNDLQARATMAASCDIAVGAYFRELNENERDYVALVCGGMVMAPRALLAPQVQASAGTEG